MGDSDFERRGMAVLESIEQQLELAMHAAGASWDSDFEGSVLRLTFEDDSRVIMNLQAPLREIWLASRRGGFHFRLNSERGWIDTRDACKLGQRVAEEVSHHAGVEIAPITLDLA